MRTHPLRPYFALALACVLAFLLFLMGIAVPQAHFWGSFLLPIVVVFLWGRRRDIYLVTALASVLVVATYWTDGAANLGDFVTYHLLPVVVLWGAAWLLAQRQQLQEQLARSKQELEEQVTARTAELQASEQRYRLLAENAGDLIWTVDMDGNMTYASPGALRVRGVTREEEQSASWPDRLPPAAAAHAAAALQADLAALRAGRPVDATPRPAPTYRKDGTLMWTETVMSPIYDDGGRPVGLCGTTRDITARKQMEDALAASERKYRELYDNSPDMYLSGYSNGYFRDCNLTAARKLGYMREELMGQPTSTIFTPASYSRIVAELPKHLAAGTWDNFEVQLQCKDGAVLDALLSAHFEPSTADHLAYSRVTLHDITARKRAEEQLRTSEEKYARFFAANPAAMCLTRRSDDVYLEVNPAYLDLTGYTRDELIGRPYSTLGVFSPGYRADLQAVVLAEGKVHNVETQIVGKSGVPVDSLVSVETIEVDGSSCSLTMMVNIPERKRSEAALAASEAQLRAVIENTEATVWSVDRNYCCLVGNSVFARAVQQIIGRPLAAGECVITEPFPQSARDFWQPLYDRALAGESFMVQIPSALHLGGTLACYLHPIYAADDTVDGVSCRAADITALKQVEAQLRAAYQHLHLAVDAANIGIWTWNFADRSLEWDDRMCEMYGVPPEKRRAGLYYELWRERVHPDDRDRAEPSHGDPIHSRSRWSTTFRIVLPGGDTRYIQVNAVKEFDEEGQPRRMIGVNHDVTDQMHYEQLLQDTNAVLEAHVAARTVELQSALTELRRAGQLKDEFMAMISHELRTPLAGVLSMAEMLEDGVAGPLNERQARYAQAITQSGERLLTVINGILSYTHLLAGKVKLEAEACELAYLLDVCATSHHHKAAGQQQTIAVAVVPPGLTIVTDAAALGEVLKRLLDNAIKFTPAGGQIGLEAHLGAAPGTVDLVVWDTGIGIPPDQLDTVFHAFIQVDARLSRSHEGIGLGLAYVDAVVRLMGGSIAVASMPGEGSRFTVTLPMYR